MVRTAATKSVGGKAFKKMALNNCIKAGANTCLEKGGNGNSVCPRETPSWQKPISSFLTMGYKPAVPQTSNDVDINQPSTSKAELVEDAPVEVVVEVDVFEDDVESNTPTTAKTDDNKNIKLQDDDSEQFRKKIKYDELCKHVEHLESLP